MRKKRDVMKKNNEVRFLMLKKILLSVSIIPHSHLSDCRWLTDLDVASHLYGCCHGDGLYLHLRLDAGRRFGDERWRRISSTHLQPCYLSGDSQHLWEQRGDQNRAPPSANRTRQNVWALRILYISVSVSSGSYRTAHFALTLRCTESLICEMFVKWING